MTAFLLLLVCIISPTITFTTRTTALVFMTNRSNKLSFFTSQFLTNRLLPKRHTFAMTTINIALCEKCHGEGSILKTPSKKARLRHQRLIQRELQQDGQNKRDNCVNKRIKRSSASSDTAVMAENFEHKQYLSLIHI